MTIKFLPYQSFTETWEDALGSAYGNSGNLENILVIGIEQAMTHANHLNNCAFFNVGKLEDVSAELLEFTGAEFPDVWICFNEIGNISKRKEKVKIVLYNAISRAIRSVFILHHESDQKFMNELETYSRDDLVLEKLSTNKKVTTAEFEHLQSSSKVLQAVRIIIVNKSLSQFKALLPVIKKRLIEEEAMNGNIFETQLTDMLAMFFPWCEKGRILEMLRLYLAETGIEMSSQQGCADF